MCVTKHCGSRGCHKLPGELSSCIEQSFFFQGRRKKSFFWSVLVLWRYYPVYTVHPSFQSDTRVFEKPHSQKSTNGNAEVSTGAPWDGERSAAALPVTQPAGNDSQALALSFPWHSNLGGNLRGKVSITHKSMFSVPILKWLVEMRLLGSAAAYFFLPSGNGPNCFCAGRLYLGYVPLNQSICSSLRAKYNESQEFLSIWKSFPKWLKLNFIRRSP